MATEKANRLKKDWELQPYTGYEVGPIRPPSEAGSLLLRITRNCSWNKCTFCGLYKDEQFSLRPTEHVLEDIRAVKRCVDAIQNGTASRELLQQEQWAFYTARNWVHNGMESVFIQDANSLIIKPDAVIRILEELQTTFPGIKRITSYARSHTAVRIKDADLVRLAAAGLNRIHIGLESGSDTVLRLVRKGTNKAMQIAAGQKVKGAGIQLSEYYMPGLGGQEYWQESALETADALNQIDPDYIRIRTLALPPTIPLVDDYANGTFTRMTDPMMVQELRLMIANLRGISSTIRSDHILNLLPDVDGELPEEQGRMLSVMDRFLQLDDKQQSLYRFGRRAGYMNQLTDVDDEERCARIAGLMAKEGVTPENIDAITDKLMMRFI